MKLRPDWRQGHLYTDTSRFRAESGILHPIDIALVLCVDQLGWIKILTSKSSGWVWKDVLRKI